MSNCQNIRQEWRCVQDMVDYNRVQITLTILSSVGSLIIIAQYIKQKQRSNVNHYVILVCFSDLTFALTNLTTNLFQEFNQSFKMVDDCGLCGLAKLSQFCNLKGFLIQFAYIIMLMNITALINYMKKIIVDDQQIDYLNPIWDIGKWTVSFSLLYATIILISVGYTPSGPNVNTDCATFYGQQGTIFRTFNTLLFIIALLYEIYVVVIILRKTKNRPEYNEDKKVLFLYPKTLFSCWILIISVRLIEVFTGYKMQSHFLNYFDYSMANLSGFFNSIVYGYLSITQKRNKSTPDPLNETFCKEEMDEILPESDTTLN